jgi:hypothetical protein
MNSFRSVLRRPALWAILVVGFLGVSQASAQSQDLSWRAMDRMLNLQRAVDQRITSLENATIYGHRNPSLGTPRTLPFPGSYAPSPSYRPSYYGTYPQSVMPTGPLYPSQPSYDIYMQYRIYNDGIEYRWIAVPR